MAKSCECPCSVLVVGQNGGQEMVGATVLQKRLQGESSTVLLARRWSGAKRGSLRAQNPNFQSSPFEVAIFFPPSHFFEAVFPDRPTLTFFVFFTHDDHEIIIAQLRRTCTCHHLSSLINLDEMSLRLFLVRHGESVDNVAGL